ncbi:DSD1 family PLP-dependent enzyme [Oxalobacteraceae bacterium R-40]|uniref:DSD1 family PLP-dependent enzyme n=1 Tax=Keguizhuia sedimenti TaxID=3064264 RepID=A0ABU1BM72_9BURK|nr:DSD1 family PLP-dependent enzyme [Oxalobacteraceae bacterium R-40]
MKPLQLPSPAIIGQDARTVGTPALLLELDAFESNLRQMAALTARHNIVLRPHAKAHKSSAIAKAQIAMGAVGICCQKLSEAYPFVLAGIRDIHISNEFVGADKIAMAVNLAQHARLSVCVDHPSQVDALGKAAGQAGVVITVLPEVDIGQGRCGVDSKNSLLALADRIGTHSGLRFGGLQAYHGGIQHVGDWGSRKLKASHGADLTASYVQCLDSRGIACPVVTGGGTGTAEFDAASGVFTEIQPGSYIFMDGHYGENGWAGELRLQHSLFIATTIMSAAKPGQAVCDVGLKGVAVDSGLPLIRSDARHDSLRYVAANDEHGILHTDADGSHNLLGERLLLIPGHCDPTCNLYEQFVCIRNNIVEALWDIDARGLSR